MRTGDALVSSKPGSKILIPIFQKVSLRFPWEYARSGTSHLSTKLTTQMLTLFTLTLLFMPLPDLQVDEEPVLTRCWWPQGSDTRENIVPSVSQQPKGLDTLLGRIIPICLQSPSPSSFKIKYLTCRRKSVNRKTYDEILIGLYLSSINWGSPLYEAPGQRSFRYFKQHSQMSHMVFSSILLAFFVVSCRLTSHSQPDYVVG